MMQGRNRWMVGVLGAAGLWLTGSAMAEIRPGRDIPPMRSFSFEVSAGYIQSLDGSVKETKRAYSDGRGPESFSRYLENYDLNELGFDDGYYSTGFALEKKWTYVTLGFGLNYSQMDASGTAEREPFAIGTDVSFNGDSYDYMLIEQGADYEVDLDLLLLDLSLDITPFHWVSSERWVSFSPWFHLGLLGVVGDYSINAGPAKGVTTYEFHPYDYVINGSGSDVVGGAIPEIGVGGELRLGLWETQNRMADLVLQAEYFLLDMDTSLGSFGVDARNDKDISIDYSGYSLDATLEIPISEQRDFLVGLRFRRLEGNADIEAKRRSEDEQDARREKYDKKVNIEFDTLYATFGLTL